MTAPKCPTCQRPMVLRDGRNGEFWACAKSYPGNNHGTYSVEVKVMRIDRAAVRITPYEPSQQPIDLELEVRKQVAAFGMHLTDLDRFVEGDWRDAEWDEDHWSNVRPY